MQPSACIYRKISAMSFTRNCDWCSREYLAERRTSRWCSVNCRVKNAQSQPADRERRAAAARDTVVIADAAPAAAADGLAAGFEAELAALNKSDSVIGKLALALAVRIDSDRTSDASRAPMAREFSRLRGELLRDVPAGDFVDELKRRRDEILAANRAAHGGDDNFLHVNPRIHAP
jgi:hypothetical protein